MYRSQFMQQAEAIGTIKFFPPLGTSFTVGTQEWLKTGLAKDKTNYAEAGNTSSCQVVGVPSTIGSPYDVRASAFNGTGTVICVTSTQVLRVSTDYGATWSAVNPSLTGCSGIAYNGTKWVIVGNNATNIYIKSSTDGVTWSNLATLSYSPANAAQNSASVCWDSVNSRFVLVLCGTSTTESSAYSADGISWTKVNLSTALITGTSSIASYNGVVLAGCSDGTIQKTTNGGTSWSTAPGSGSNCSNIVVANSKFWRIASASSIASSTNGTSWTTSTTVPELGFGVANLNYQCLASDGTTLFFNANASKHVGYTADGTSFYYKSAKWATGTGACIACSGTDKVFATNGSSDPGLYIANIKGSDYIGTSTTYYNLGTTYQAGYLVGYMRIR